MLWCITSAHLIERRIVCWHFRRVTSFAILAFSFSIFSFSFSIVFYCFVFNCFLLFRFSFVFVFIIFSFSLTNSLFSRFSTFSLTKITLPSALARDSASWWSMLDNDQTPYHTLSILSAGLKLTYKLSCHILIQFLCQMLLATVNQSTDEWPEMFLSSMADGVQ